MNPLRGFTRSDYEQLFGDEIDRPVGWKRAHQETTDYPSEGEVAMEHGYDVGSLRGQTVRIRFILQEADLYFQVRARRGPPAVPPVAHVGSSHR